MTKQLSIILWCFLATSIWSCTKAIIDEENPVQPIDENITYNPDIQGIMYNHCITCHGGATPAAGFTLTSYEDVRSYAEQGVLLSRINDAANPMPPGSLMNAENILMIEKWAADGFPEN